MWFDIIKQKANSVLKMPSNNVSQDHIHIGTHNDVDVFVHTFDKNLLLEH